MTSVGAISQLAEPLAGTNSNFAAKYYPGPGTDGTLPLSAAIPTAEINRTAELAYAHFSIAAEKWWAVHSGADAATAITAAVTGFSRGCATSIAFAQLLNERGLTIGGTVIIPPCNPETGTGGVPVIAMMLLDPVSTGYLDDLTIPSNVNSDNCVAVRARDELRYAFKADDYGTSRVEVIETIGCHGDVGGCYVANPDSTTGSHLDGLGALVYQGYVGFFRNVGIPLGEIQADRTYDASAPATIHSEATDDYGNVIWSTSGEFGSERLIRSVAGSHVDETAFVYSLGDGNITVKPEGAQQDFTLHGIAASDVQVFREGMDALLVLMPAGQEAGTIRIKSWYLNTNPPLRSIKFDSGPEWTAAQFDNVPVRLMGTQAEDTLSAPTDFLAPYVLAYGNDRNDIIHGGTGNDILNGGPGNDTLYGGAGTDTCSYKKGEGQDTVYTESAGDKLLIQGYSSGDVIVSRSEADMVLTYSSQDKVTIKDWFLGGDYQIAQARFDDATLSAADLEARIKTNAPQVGTDNNDTISAPFNVAASLYGGGGGDTLMGSRQADYLNGGSGNDKLYGDEGNDILCGGADQDTLDGGIGADTLCGDAGDDVLGGAIGTPDSGVSYSWVSYNYEVVAAAQGNTYEGGRGNDILNGTSKADTYRFNLGDGVDTIIEPYPAAAGVQDVLSFGPGIAPADLRVLRAGNDLTFVHTNGLDKVTVKNWYSSAAYQIEQVQFADGTTWLAADLTAQGLVVTGTAGNDTLTGVSFYSNVLLGGAGNDILTGGPLADFLSGGDGNDSGNGMGGVDQLYGDAGADTLKGDEGNDLLDGGTGNDTLDGGSGFDTLRGGAGDDVLGGVLGSVDSGLSYSYVSYGYNVVAAALGNSYEGGLGSDTLNGTSKADTYLFNLGDGADTVIEPAPTAVGQIDILRFGAGIAPADIKVVRDGTNLIFAHTNGLDKITFQNWYGGGQGSTEFQVERIEFADGTVWASADLTAQGLEVHGTEGANRLDGVAQWVNSLYGEGGNDTLYGGNQGDLLFGGAGNDSLNGGPGNDIYRHFAGGGWDSVTEYYGTDTVAFEGVFAEDAQFFRNNNDLYVAVGGSPTEGVIIKNQFYNPVNKVELFQFADSTYTSDQVTSLMLIGIPPM